MSPWFRQAGLLLALMLVACAANRPPPLERQEQRPVQRTTLADLHLPEALPGGATLTGAWELHSSLPITGLSAMALSNERLLLATDNGDLFDTSCPAGQSLGACSDTWRYGGKLIARGSPRADLEGLAIRPDGSVVLGLENRPRLARLEGDLADGFRIGRLAQAPDLGFLPKNEGPEAITSLPDGRLIVLPEGGVDADGRALVLLQDAQGGWHRHHLSLPTTGLVPTEAAVAGDHLFVLLRGLSILTGWHCAVLTLPLAALVDPGEALAAPRLIAVIGDARFTDNLEAMAVRQLSDRSYSLLIASDDNGFVLQRPLLLTLSWRPEAGW